MRQFVDERQFGLPGDHRLGIHLLEPSIPVLDDLPRHDFEVADHVGSEMAVVCLDITDHDIGPPAMAAPAFVEHGARLADAGSRTEVDPETPRRLDVACLDAGGGPGGCVSHRPILP